MLQLTADLLFCAQLEDKNRSKHLVAGISFFILIKTIMMKLKAVIVEDEQHAIDLLSIIIRDTIPSVEIVGSAKKIESGIKVIKNSTPDVVFLDVLLAGDNGFDMLHQIGAG